MPLARIRSVVLDCPDPTALAEFYRAVLGGQTTSVEDDWVVLGFINHGAGLKDAIISYQEKYAIQLRLEVKRGEPFFRSDDYYFDQTQHEAVVLTDSYNVQSPNNHTANDILENVNFRTSRKVIQLALVTVAEQAGMGG